jgi:putrescine transport system ATP-binding protein
VTASELPNPQATNADDAFLRLADVSRHFGAVRAVDQVSLDVRAGEFFTLLGGSGCGKTTLLRMIAGFEQPDRGRITIAGADMTELPPYRRPVNMMFQSYALFPHLSVFDNVAFGLRQERLPRAEVRARVHDALAQFEIEALARRRPDQLSGGQRQRVALARALVKRPALLLLDEPLAALDRRLRQRTALELANIQRQVGITFVMVTHDQEEAMNLSTRIGVMRDGALAQVGTPREIYETPANAFVAGFVGTVNLLPCTVTAAGALHCSALGTPLLGGVERGSHNGFSSAAECVVAIRPERLRLRAPAGDRDPSVARETSYEGLNRAEGILRAVVYLGAQLLCELAVSPTLTLTIAVPAGGLPIGLERGARAIAEWAPDDQRVLPA